MTTPIRPSLAQMLNPQSASVTATPKPAQPEGGFASALQAQKAFFQQVTAPKITPANYTAADIAQATNKMASPTQSAPTTDASQPLRRPGSYLNIVI